MGPTESRPFVQQSREQRASTTANINLYPCTSLVPTASVLFLDYEGEHGSEAPALLGSRAGGASIPTTTTTSSSSLSAVSSSMSALLSRVTSTTASSSSSISSSTSTSSSRGGPSRSDAVRDLFPKLAYTSSDVVCVVGTEPFFSTRYLERVVAFSQRANAGVSDADLPILLLICNRRDADACELDLQASTAQFAAAMGDSVRTLDQYYASLLCVYLPNRRSKVDGCDAHGNPCIFDGAVLYSQQVAKMRRVLSALLGARLESRYGGTSTSSSGGGGGGGGPSRSISARQSLWYELLPRVVREINAGRTVHVLRLVDEAWAAASARVGAERDRLADTLKALAVWTRPHPSLSGPCGAEAVSRFSAYVLLARELSIRVAAAQLRAAPAAARVDARARTFCAAQVIAMDVLLTAVAPCVAVYGSNLPQGTAGIPIDTPNAPLLCLQERRAHGRGHRASRPVRGGGVGLWARLTTGALGAHTPVWSGVHESAPLPPLNVRRAGDVALALARADPAAWLSELASLASRHTTSSVQISFARISQSKAVDETVVEIAAEDDDVKLDDEDALPAWPTNMLVPITGTTPKIKLRKSPIISTELPYCVACASKSIAAAIDGGSSGNNNNNAQDSIIPVAKKSTAKRWSAETFLNMVGSLVGVGGGAEEEMNSIGGGAGGGGGSIESSTTSVISSSSSTAVQAIVLGICGGCIKSARGLGLVEDI
jgi:hypothetical protein